MRRLPADERGMTLPEVLIAMVITSVVTSVLLMGTVSIYRGHNFTQQDSASLGALRTSLDRFEKEVRQARIMYDDSTGKLVHVWVDYDRDNQQDDVEQILWEIEDLGSGRAQLDVRHGGDRGGHCVEKPCVRRRIGLRVQQQPC